MRRPLRRYGLAGLAGLLLAGGCTTAPTTDQTPARLAAEERTAHNLRVFDRAWALVNAKYFDAKFRGVDWAAMRVRYRPEAAEARDDDKLYAVINTLLGELKESHNVALTPQRALESKIHQRARVGVGLRRLDDRWVVTEVMAGSPAEAAGVRPGWLLVSRDGRPFAEMSGRPLADGQATTYEFLDERDQPRILAMTARLLSTGHSLEARELAGGIVYLRFDAFDRTSRRWLSDQLKAHRAAPAVVVDLRQNIGGWFFSLGISLGEFFPRPVQLGTVIWRNGHESEQDSWQWSAARYTGRVVLLVDGATASCAEIFADTLHHYHRAVLVGRKTAGAVVVARLYSLPDGGRLQIGVEDFLGLDGRRLEGAGVPPDVAVALKLADLRAGLDPDLAAALAALQPR